ncbi:unnamed protein product, partial [Rotaria sp. Silwood1]
LIGYCQLNDDITRLTINALEPVAEFG